MYRRSRDTYGRPRIQANLRDEYIHVGGKRIWRLMRERKLRGRVLAIRPQAKKPATASVAATGSLVVEMRGLEPLTPYMRSKCSTS